MPIVKRLILLLVFIYISNHAKSQVKHTGKVETGYHLLGSRPIRVQPGSGRRGYQLDESPNSSYLNYEGIKGYTVFGDL